ncbi:AraC family transcriptional regulator [Allorhodopirellula solitaria]|uniref:HTH-type transcriptional regulator CdhR n=1 Tax=Allorhodopirellula solitaria TaxID=2527987 RepID=A0A5C5WPB6_9BACT|nr:helix-turn-helix domain-containing protein [Allorhodopirellula solitaria]TWT51682.1 HTH-type transcriptional regulator CdhR [Allorhodopirellula solitaria]
MRTERNGLLRAAASDDAVTSIDLQVLSKLFDSAPDTAFFVKDAEGRYLAVNESLVKRHGLRSKADVIGKQPRDICQGEFGQVPSKQDEKVLRTGRSLNEHLEMHWNRPRHPVWCLTTKLPLHDPAGNVVGLVGFSRDVRVSIPTDEIPTAYALAMEEFERTLDPAVTPAWLAERSELTTTQLARFTRRVFDLTPTQLIAKIRIAAASRLLRDTEKPVVVIALDCGFSDHSAFTRAFRRATGVTPSVFRKQR